MQAHPDPYLTMYHLSVFMQATIKLYGKDTYKIIYQKSNGHAPESLDVENFLEGHNVSTTSTEWWKDREKIRDGEKTSEKSESNVARARSSIREYALCNEWQYFVTLTLNEGKQDRFDLDGYIKDLGVWIGNYNRKYGAKLYYLLIPEQHKNGAWHMHGLFGGIAPGSLTINEYGYNNIPYYEQRFGYISLSQIRDSKKCASYITKYVSKALNSTDIDVYKHLYYHSRGLAKAEIITQFCVEKVPAEAWQNDYCGIEWIDSDELLTARLESIGKETGNAEKYVENHRNCDNT